MNQIILGFYILISSIILAEGIKTGANSKLKELTMETNITISGSKTL